MSLHLSHGGSFWKLPKRQKLQTISDAIQAAMRERSPLSVKLEDGDTLILNGARMDYVLVFDDHGDPRKAFSSMVDLYSMISYGSMISSGLGDQAIALASEAAKGWAPPSPDGA